MDHKLVGDTLNGTKGGIVAQCTCGWSSGPRFSSMIASVAFMDHKDEAAAEQRRAERNSR